jgi:hypothetical protein
LFDFQNKTVFAEMEPALHLANKVVRKLIKVDKVCSKSLQTSYFLEAPVTIISS